MREKRMWMRGNNDYISVVIYFYILFCFVGVKGEEICFFYILFCFVRVKSEEKIRRLRKWRERSFITDILLLSYFYFLYIYIYLLFFRFSNFFIFYFVFFFLFLYFFLFFLIFFYF